MSVCVVAVISTASLIKRNSDNISHQIHRQEWLK
jgi:hypothetical protein